MKQTSNTAGPRCAGLPCSYYLEQYRAADPVRISNRLGIPFDLHTGRFRFTFFGKEYEASHPDLHIQCKSGKDPFSPDSSEAFRSLLLRWFLKASVFPAGGDFREIRDLPGGELWADHFEEQCVRRLSSRYGRVLQAFEAIMEDLDAIRVFGDDIAYEAEFLDGLFIRFQFRSGGPDREPAARILFSDNFPAAFSACELEEIISLCMEAFDAADPLLAAANPYR